MRFGLFYVAFGGALMFVANVESTDSFTNRNEWKRELDVPRSININFNDNAYPTAAQNRDVGTTAFNGTLTLQLILRIDPFERQVNLEDTIPGRRFAEAARQNTKPYEGRGDDSPKFKIVDPAASPAFIELQKINREQGRRKADGKGGNHQRVTTVPRHLKPLVSRTTASYPILMPPGMQFVDRTPKTNDEWTGRRSTVARYPISIDPDDGSILLEHHWTTEKSKAAVSRRKTLTRTVSDADILLQNKRNESDFYGYRKRQITGEGSVHAGGDGIQLPEFNLPIFRTSGKLLTTFPAEVRRQTTGTPPVAGHSHGHGAILNPTQQASSTLVTNQMHINQTTDDVTASESPNPPVYCEELQCMPWERRDNFEVQVDPRTKEIVNVRVHTIAENSKLIIKSTEASKSTEALNLPASSTSGKDEEFDWRYRDDHGIQLNPQTEQIVIAHLLPNATKRPTVRLDGNNEDYGAEESVTETSEAVLERTVTNTEYEGLIWFDRQDHQVQIDRQTGQVVNIRTPAKIESNYTTEATSARHAISTRRVTTQASLPIPFYYRKKIASHSGDSESMSSNLTRDDVQTETETVKHGRNVPITSPPSIPEPSEVPVELPWQPKHGFEVQIHPVTKEVVNIRMQTVTNERSIPIPVPTEQPTLPASVQKTITTLTSETSWDSDESLWKTEDDNQAQRNVETTATVVIPNQSRARNVPRNKVVKITHPISKNTGGQMSTTLAPAAERSTESTVFPWQQRDDYEVQIDPQTQQIVNIRLQTTITDNPVSKSTQFKETNDPVDDSAVADDSLIVQSQTGDRIRTVDTIKIIKPHDERDSVFDEHSDSILDRNSKIRTQVVPRRKEDGEELIKHIVRTDDDLSDEPRSRIAVITTPNHRNTANRPSMNGRPRAIKTHKPIFSHSDADDRLYFHFADNDNEWEELEVEQLSRDAKFVLVEEDDWISHRRGRVRNSPYFYYSQRNSSSTLISFSYDIMLSFACFMSFISQFLMMNIRYYSTRTTTPY